MKKRHAKSYARENAFKSLYSYAMMNDEEAIKTRSEFERERDDELANEMAMDTIKNIVEIDELIQKNLVKWSIKNISLVNLSVLRLAIYEIKYQDTPAGIVINEALNLTSKYSEEKSKKFIHKILDNVAN